MTSEKKELLLKDLSARLPYGVIVEVEYYDASLKDAHVFKDIVLTIGNINKLLVYWVSAKPYLRPMSSMTEEEFKEFHSMLIDVDNSGLMNQRLITKIVDWLDKKTFDHRNLIPKGLALKAKEGMYESKNNI